jgi:uncharacterized protein YfiM (DUF2279 family)
MKAMKAKFIILFLLLISGIVLCNSQNVWKTEWLKNDKAMHLSVSTALTMLGTETAKDFHLKNPEVAGIVFSLTAGMAKEFLYDKQAPSVYDLGADIVGALAGVYLNRWINRLEENAFRKRQNKNAKNVLSMDNQGMYFNIKKYRCH